jgi:3-deoxy-D-manno-octulosonic acid kinase
MSNVKVKQQDCHYWKYDIDCFENISETYFTAQYWQNINAIEGQENGRGTTWFIQHKNHHLVLRHYLRGGMIGKISRDRYIFNGWKNCRAISEFNILNDLHAQGFRVPKPAAAQIIRHGLSYQADLFTHRIPKAQDLVQILTSAKNQRFYSDLGKTIAEFHNHGVYHADLNIQNILQDDQNQFWLIDFDRAKLVKPSKKWQLSNLKRLKRSFEKEKIRFGIQWQESDWHIFLRAYQATIS